MDEDRRRDYRSILPGTEVIYRAAPVRPQDRRYLLGVAENLSFGGLFISTRHPFGVGTMVLLDLYPGAGADRAPFSARAVVRWRQLWREPRGMGLQFLDFADLAERPMADLLDDALVPPPLVLNHPIASPSRSSPLSLPGRSVPPASRRRP